MTSTVTAADLLGFRLCTGQCLLGLEDQCVCRCRGRWHAVLAGAEIPVPPGLTLADALSGGPAGIRARRRSWAAVQSAGNPRRVTPADAELHFATDVASGWLPSVRRIRRELHVGQDRARQIRAHLETLARA